MARNPDSSEIDPFTKEGQERMERIYQQHKQKNQAAMQRALIDPDGEPNVLTTPSELTFKRMMKKLKNNKLDSD